jgi:hypothetical protein
LVLGGVPATFCIKRPDAKPDSRSSTPGTLRE